MALWDGRFSGGPAEEMVVFSECLGVDMQMWPDDIACSERLTWKYVAKGGKVYSVASAEEVEAIIKGG